MSLDSRTRQHRIIMCDGGDVARGVHQASQLANWARLLRYFESLLLGGNWRRLLLALPVARALVGLVRASQLAPTSSPLVLVCDSAKTANATKLGRNRKQNERARAGIL